MFQRERAGSKCEHIRVAEAKQKQVVNNEEFVFVVVV